MKNLDDIDKGELLQLCGEMNRFIDVYVQNHIRDDSQHLGTPLRLNQRFAVLTGDFPDSDCEREARP